MLKDPKTLSTSMHVDSSFSSILQVTAIHPVGEGQCIALGYESVLPLVLLTLQGGDVKPYEFPTEGTKAIAGTGMVQI